MLSTFGDSLVPLTLAFASFQVGGASALGLVLATNRLPIAVLVLFGGALGDRWSRKWLMVSADVLRCGTQAATGLLLVLGAAELWHLVVLQALAGAGTAVFTPTASGLVPSLVPADLLQRANALLGLAANTNKVLSISTAGILVATVGSGTALLVDAGTFAASGLALVLLRMPREAPIRTRSNLWREVRAGTGLVARTPWLLTLLAYSAFFQALVIGPHMIAGPLLAAEAYGGAGAWATIGVVQAVGSVVGGALALRWHPRRPLYAAVAISLLLVPYLLLFALNAPLWLVAASALAVGAQGAFFLTAQSTAIQRNVPESARSRIAAWAQLGNLVLLPASLALSGPVIAEFGAPAVLLAGTGWLLVSTLLVLRTSPIRDLRYAKASPTDAVREANGACSI